MKDPAAKYLKVPSGQEVNLSPKGIVVQCSGGAVRIEVLKSGKINLYADDEIQISAKGEIKMDTKRIIRIQGEKSILMESEKGASLDMDKKGNITIKGIEVYMN